MTAPHPDIPSSGAPHSGIPHSGIPSPAAPHSGTPHSDIPSSAAPHSGTPLLDVSDLAVSIPGREEALVSGVDLTLAPGERLGVIGESGSGKSLTALAVLGLLPHPLRASGRVALDTDGGPVDVVSASQRRLDSVRGSVVSAVFQEPLTALDPLMRVGKQLAWPIAHHRGLRGDALRRAVLDALASVQLAEPERVARSYIHEISGGQRQRVAIAIALASEPRLLLADEPTTALDVTVQAGVLELLDAAVRERGMAMLFISHDLAVVSRVSDRVLVMRDGRALETGPVDQVLRAPSDPYTAALVASARTLEAQLPPRSSDQEVTP